MLQKVLFKALAYWFVTLVIACNADLFGQQLQCPVGAYTPTHRTDNGAGNWYTTADWNGSAPPAAWTSGGVLTIPYSATIKINSSNFNLVGVSLVVNGRLIIDGKLNLDAGQTVTIGNDGILCCEGTNCGSGSDRLSIGGSVIWDGNDGAIQGYATSNGGPLPVDLLFFRALTISEGVRLTWATASERNSSNFAVERSLNGKDFEEIGNVAAAGNSISRQEYSFLDDACFLGRNYYRLKQVDVDGTYEYFNITFADTDGEKAVIIYPNPVQDHILQLRLNFASEDPAAAKIYSSTGAIVGSFGFSGPYYTGETSLRPGTYVLKVSVGNELLTHRFIIP